MPRQVYCSSSLLPISSNCMDLFLSISEFSSIFLFLSLTSLLPSAQHTHAHTHLPVLYLCFNLSWSLSTDASFLSPSTHIDISVVEQTVLKGPLPEDVKRFLEKPPRTASPERHLYIDVDDVEDANLLQHFPKTNAFIRSVLTRDMTLDQVQEKTNSACLVHCAQGVSRSAAVIAAYLMETNNVDHEEAIKAVRHRRPSTAPNEGFVRQLALFSAMNCRLDASFIPYKRFLAEQAALVVQKTGTIDRESLSEPEASFDHQRDDSFGANPPTLYRCRKCRSLVATSRNIIEVDSKSKQEAFSWRKRQKEVGLVASSVGEEAPSGDIFVEPLKWMTTVLEGHLQGKLYCPR